MRKKKICERCNELHFTETHHIISQSKGGSNAPNNLVELCGNCHNGVHAGAIILEGIFLTSNGYQLIWHLKNAESITGSEPETYIID